MSLKIRTSTFSLRFNKNYNGEDGEVDFSGIKGGDIVQNSSNRSKHLHSEPELGAEMVATLFPSFISTPSSKSFPVMWTRVLFTYFCQDLSLL